MEPFPESSSSATVDLLHLLSESFNRGNESGKLSLRQPGVARCERGVIFCLARWTRRTTRGNHCGGAIFGSSDSNRTGNVRLSALHPAGMLLLAACAASPATQPELVSSLAFYLRVRIERVCGSRDPDWSNVFTRKARTPERYALGCTCCRCSDAINCGGFGAGIST